MSYILLLIWPLALMFLSQFTPMYRKEYVLGQKKYRLDPFWAVVGFAPIIYMTTYRNIWIGDTYAYITTFRKMPTTLADLMVYLPTVTKDKGFSVLTSLIKLVINEREIWYLGILALIQSICLIYVYRKYSTDYFLSIFLFIASTDYISWMYNGIRQFTAVTLIFVATDLMLKKKYVPLIGIILLASTIHGSALLMIPIVFIARGKAWNQKTIMVIIGALIALVFVDNFTSILDVLLEDTQYTNVVSDWQSWNDDGTNVFRVLVYSVPTLMSFTGRKYIEEDNNAVINLCTNMSIISTGLYLISMGTSGIFMGRLPIYCSLYGYILLPYLIKRMFSKQSGQLIMLIMVSAYVIFYYYQMHFAWGIM